MINLHQTIAQLLEPDSTSGGKKILQAAPLVLQKMGFDIIDVKRNPNEFESVRVNSHHERSPIIRGLEFVCSNCDYHIGLVSSEYHDELELHIGNDDWWWSRWLLMRKFRQSLKPKTKNLLVFSECGESCGVIDKALYRSLAHEIKTRTSGVAIILNDCLTLVGIRTVSCVLVDSKLHISGHLPPDWLSLDLSDPKTTIKSMAGAILEFAIAGTRLELATKK